MQVVLLTFHQGELLHYNRASFLLEGMRVLCQMGHSLKNNTATSEMNTNSYIIVQSIWRLWMVVKFSVMCVRGTEEENTSMVYFQTHLKPCGASIKSAQPICLSVCTKQLKNCLTDFNEI